MTDRVPEVAKTCLLIDGMHMTLRRFATKKEPKHAVLLLHGGNTSSELFHWPAGGLIRYLAEADCDVWTLDWRTSADILGPLIRKHAPLLGSVEAERSLFTLDRVAELEIPVALRTMRELGVHNGIGVLGFCLAGGALAKAVARGHLEGLGVDNVVLATMGLFYEVAWDGWVKSEDFLIERILSVAPKCRSIDPFDPDDWPEPMKAGYKGWPKPWLRSDGDRPVDELFRRLTYCYGQPYARAQLDLAFECGLDEKFFGPIHLGMYLHASQMIRRGYSARFNALDVIDRTRIARDSGQVEGSDLLPDHFKTKRVTVITGSDDQLWHRDSIDLMYEWLRNEATDPAGNPRDERLRHRKFIARNYGHLDIFWGMRARQDVYAEFHRGLTQRALSARLPVVTI